MAPTNCIAHGLKIHCRHGHGHGHPRDTKCHFAWTSTILWQSLRSKLFEVEKEFIHLWNNHNTEQVEIYDSLWHVPNHCTSFAFGFHRLRKRNKWHHTVSFICGLFKKYREFWISAGYVYSFYDFLWRFVGTHIPHICRQFRPFWTFS